MMVERQVCGAAVWSEPCYAVMAVDHAPSLPLSQAEVPALCYSPPQEERRKKKKKKTAVRTPALPNRLPPSHLFPYQQPIRWLLDVAARPAVSELGTDLTAAHMNI